MAVGKPGLVVHAFAPIGGVPADRDLAWAHLQSIWAACGQLGMDGPLLDSLATELPVNAPERDTPGFSLLAGRSRVTADRVAQAYAFTRHDVVGICIALASTSERDQFSTWSGLLDEWRTAGGAVPQITQLLGTDLCFVADVDGDLEAFAKRHGEGVTTTLRGAGLDLWDVPFRTADGFTLWEWQDNAGQRVFAALSTRAAADDLSRWLWWQGDRELPPFARYLLNASKLGYEVRVYDEYHRGMGQRIRAVGTDLAELKVLQDRGRPGSPSSMQRVQAAQEKLADAQIEAAELAIDLTHLRSLKRTVSIARHNLALTAPQAAPGQQVTAAQMFERDQALAAWLDGQVDQDVGYAEAVVERAREAQNVTQLRLQQSLTQLSRAQNRVALLQTSVLGALLASLTIVSVLQVVIPTIDEALKVPMVAAFVSLQLALPALAAHWYERYGNVDLVVATIFGASTGWLVAALVAGAPTPPLAALVGVAVGVAAARGLTTLHDRWLLAEEDRAASVTSDST